MSESEQDTKYTPLKRNDYKIFNTFLRRKDEIKYNLIEKIHYS